MALALWKNHVDVIKLKMILSLSGGVNTMTTSKPNLVSLP